jgi:hypothetical protein
MAVGRLSGARILEILRTNYPEGVLRRALLDQFAAQLVTPKAKRGAKGRLAKRLYSRLELLQRKGMIAQEEGVVRPLAVAEKSPKDLAMPLLGTVLRRKQFLVLLAEDRPEGKDAALLRQFRWDFLASAVSQGWTVVQAAKAIGLSPAKAAEIITKPKG